MLRTHAVANPRWRSLVAIRQSSEIKFEFGNGLSTLIANKLVRKNREWLRFSGYETALSKTKKNSLPTPEH